MASWTDVISPFGKMNTTLIGCTCVSITMPVVFVGWIRLPIWICRMPVTPSKGPQGRVVQIRLVAVDQALVGHHVRCVLGNQKLLVGDLLQGDRILFAQRFIAS